jgi:hypothetical protein
MPSHDVENPVNLALKIFVFSQGKQGKDDYN